MSWNVQVDIEPAAQSGDNRCGAASVQMLLSTVGVKGIATELQTAFEDSINIWKGPWQNGSPLGVAHTINRYNVGATALGDKAPRPELQYVMKRESNPYDACATIVNALYERGSASAVLVFGNTHWVVVFGGSGDGYPRGGSTYNVDGFWLIDPDNSFSQGNPGKQQGFLFSREHVTYESFLYDYFDGGNDPLFGGGNTRQPFGDGHDFIFVADTEAVPRGNLALPVPEDVRAGPITVDAAIAALLKANTLPSLIGAIQKKPLWVSAKGRFAKYRIVPFVKDGTVDVVRFDENGVYRGAALGLPDQGQFDDVPLAIRQLEQTLNLKLSAESIDAAELLWAPNRDLASPYNPYFVLRDTPHGTILASLDGRTVITDQHDVTSVMA